MFCSSIVAQFGEGKNKENTSRSVNNDDGFHAWDSLRSFLGENRVPFLKHHTDHIQKIRSRKGKWKPVTLERDIGSLLRVLFLI